MERIRDSVRASCSSSFSSSPTGGLSFKRRPTSQTNEEEDWQTSPLPDRAARKEIERQRLRKLLNQGKQKRRRLNGSKLSTSPGNGVDGFHCHKREPRVPRKARSVGYRRKCKYWKSIGLLAQLQQPKPAEKSSPFSVQSEIEIEFEIAEVLSGLKKQVSSSDESLIDELDKIRVENEDGQPISACACSVEQASKCAEIFKSSDSISVTSSLKIQNNDKKANLTASLVIPTPQMEAAESKQAYKFIIDLNEPPPMESSLEGVGMEIKADLQDLKLRNPDDTMSQKQQKAYGSDLHCPKGFSVSGNLNSIKDGAQYLYSNNFNQENHYRPASTPKVTHEHASNQIPKPLQSGRMKVGPLIFPLRENQSVMVNRQSGLSRTATSNGNVTFTYPIGASFLSVLSGNACSPNSSYEGNRLHSSGGKNTQPVPFLDEQLLPPQQRFLPIHIQHQNQANSSVSDIRRFSNHRNGTQHSLYPPCSPNITSMPSAASLFSFASSAQSRLHLSQNPQVVRSFLQKTNLGLQMLPSDHGSQQRNSEMIQKNNQADSLLAAGEAPSWIKQSGFVLKSHTTLVTTPNCKLSVAKQNASSARIHQSDSNSFGASVQFKTQQQLQAIAASQLERVPTASNQHQPPIAAKVSNDFSILSASLYDRSSSVHNPSQQKLTISSSQPLT